MHELLTVVLAILRWLAYLSVTLLIPVAVVVPTVAVVNRLPVGPYTSAGLSGLSVVITLGLIRALWRRYLRHSQAKSGRHHQR